MAIKRIHLAPEEIEKIGVLFLKKDVTLSDISEQTKLEKTVIRSVIAGLRRAGVEFPEKPRERSSKYEFIAKKLLTKVK